MKIEEFAQVLKEEYLKAATNEKVVTIHLFGIRNADQLDGMPLHDIAERAGISRTYGTELRKGIKLARYVKIK